MAPEEGEVGRLDGHRGILISMARIGWLVVLWATGCGKAPPGIQPEPRPSQEPAAQAKRPPRMPEASAVAGEKVEYRGVFSSKPPLKIFSFDVTLRNPESEPRNRTGATTNGAAEPHALC